MCLNVSTFCIQPHPETNISATPLNFTYISYLGFRTGYLLSYGQYYNTAFCSITTHLCFIHGGMLKIIFHQRLKKNCIKVKKNKNNIYIYNIISKFPDLKNIIPVSQNFKINKHILKM